MVSRIILPLLSCLVAFDFFALRNLLALMWVYSLVILSSTSLSVQSSYQIIKYELAIFDWSMPTSDLVLE